LRGICEHLASGYTVRERIAEAGRLPAAVLSSEGQLLDADDAASEPETRRRLTDAIVRMDRARCRRRRCSPGEALELWQALVDGQYSLVESFDRDGRRLILAVRVRSDIRALTPREIAVVRLAVQGLSNKKIAGRLGIATSTVSVHLRRALRKLGCASRSELVARASTLFWGG
jgi:DNA-binding NarL/FixJ family response regulator